MLFRDVPDDSCPKMSVLEGGSPTRSKPVSPQEKTPRLWAIGGGKGGVGKSMITTNMALNLARSGQRCLLIDADLGGANLHTLVGMPNPSRTLSNFFRRDVESLHEIILPTPYENLSIISGARALLEMANPVYAQKMKLIRQIFSLDFDHVFLDLGAGSSFTVLDFFLVARNQVIVVVPTPTSVENAYHFLRAVFYRKLRKAIQKAKVKHVVDHLLEEKVKRGIRSPREMVDQVIRMAPETGPVLQSEVQTFAPKLIVNQVRRREDKALGEHMAAACRDFFGIDVECAGSVQNDERVVLAIQARRPVLEMFPDSPFAVSLQSTAKRLLVF